MQFIPRLLSTSINNKHHHETRAGLGGWRRHRPARSTSDQIPFQRVSYTELSNCFPLGLFSVAGTPRHKLYSCLLAHIKAAFLSPQTETPSVVAVVAASTCGSRQETDALAQDSSASLTCPHAFLQSASTPCDWHLLESWWHESVSGRVTGDLPKKRKCVFQHINIVLYVKKGVCLVIL